MLQLRTDQPGRKVREEREREREREREENAQARQADTVTYPQ
jgi:hypothetical protein